MSTEPAIQRVCNESARGVYFIAGTMALLGLVVAYTVVLDAAVLAGLGFWLQRSRSRVPAALILAMGAANSLLALMNLAGFKSAVHPSPISAALFVWLGARALLAINRAAATALEHKRPAQQASPLIRAIDGNGPPLGEPNDQA
jgi:hypothetical protein